MTRVRADRAERSAPGLRSLPRLHVVTDDSVLRAPGFEARAVDVMQAGGDAVALHVRGPGEEGARLYALVKRLLPHARRTGAFLFVNDRVDVAMVLLPDGVHLGRRSLPVAAARGLLTDSTSLGASAGAPGGAAGLRREGADYVFLGTIFETLTHPGAPGTGLESVAHAADALGAVPLIGIGGIDVARAADVVRAGAYGVAVIRGVWSVPDVASAVAGYLNAMTSGRDAA